jgi:hypothetical protein
LISPRSIFLRVCLALVASAAAPTVLSAQPVISEFMAANRATLADADGAFSDWIEIHNPDDLALDLRGWYLTDLAGNKTKWQFPAVTLPAGGYLVVFASSKNRTDPEGELHTNFALSAGGEYLGLIRPDGTTVAFEYAPEYVAQTDDVSYGVVPRTGGGFKGPVFFQTPTPGRANVPPEPRVTFSRASGPFTEDFLLQLAGAEEDQTIRYVRYTPTVNGPPPPELTAESPEYVAPLRVDGSAVISAAVFSRDGQKRGEVANVYFARIAPDVAGFASKLPVLVIDSLATGPLDKDAIDHPAWMYVYPVRTGGGATLGSPPDLVTSLTATVRGSSSSFFPKKGLNLKLTDANGGKRSQSLLGLPAHDKWALIAPWNFDPAYINNAFVYALSNRLGRWAPRMRFAELFVNADGGAVEAADYVGVYAITDRIEVGAARVAIAALDASDVAGGAVTGGYIIKLDTPDYDEFSWTSNGGVPAELFTAIVLVEPKADEIVPAQRAYLVDYVQRMEDALRADRATGFAQRTYLDYLDRPSWVDHHILNTFAANPDALERSAYFTKPRAGRLQAGPVWDFDRALGSVADERSLRWDVWSGEGAADVWNTGWWGLLAQDPEFMQDWVDRWQALRRTSMSTASLVDLATALAAEVGPEAAAREAARWPERISPEGNFAAEVDRFKGWIVQRAEWIDRQLVAAPTVRLEGEMLVFTAAHGAQLIHTTDGSDPRALGGGIAPNAIVSTGSIAVPAGLNVQVRSHREDLKNVFPGSPWSSAVGGINSSPLAPAARIVNFSMRAMVGSGPQSLITGVTVADTSAKRYLARAIGPGLVALGTEGGLADPELSVVSGAGTELARNSGWQDGPDAVLMPGLWRTLGAMPLLAGNRDAALISRMAAGSFSVHVATATDRSGVSLFEVFEMDGDGRTASLSTRAHVGAGDRVLIGGFVVRGVAHKRLMIRAVGPTLAELGVDNALSDPVLRVFSGEHTVVSNDRWESSANPGALRAAARTQGAFQLLANSEDAAVLITLPPGAYSIEVQGKGAAEGIALLEIYEVP